MTYKIGVTWTGDLSMGQSTWNSITTSKDGTKLALCGQPSSSGVWVYNGDW